MAAKPKKSKKRKRKPPPMTRTPAYQIGYSAGFQTAIILVREACDLNDVPAAERDAARVAVTRILNSISTAMHELQACGRESNHH
jgi:hypothetical protein